MSEPDRETVLNRLQDAEINCWLGTAPPGHISAVLIVGETDVGRDFQPDADGRWPRAAIATWLLKTARRYYPEAGL